MYLWVFGFQIMSVHVYKWLLIAYSLLLLSSDVYRIHNAAQGFRDLFGSHGVLLKLGLHSRL